MFQRAGVGMGIVGIITCGIATFIWGWIKAKELALTKVMAIWTVCWLVSVGTGMVAGGMMAKSIAENPEFQKAMQDAQQRAQQQQTTPAPAPAPSN
jgi:anaerobic C4-dicarboxylate transporter